MTATTRSPADQAIRMMDGCVIAQLVHVAAELGIADLLAAGPRSVAQLASATNTDHDALDRALRTLAGEGMFQEVAPQIFGLTALADTLRSDSEHSVRDLARIRGGREHWLAWTDLEHTVRTGRSAFRHAYGTDFWTYLAENPSRAELFNKAMGSGTKRVHTAAINGYDWSSAGHVVDVGGGRGDLIATLLQRHPHLTATLFDQPAGVADAGAVLQQAGVQDRVRVQEGSFFDSIPPGGDTYVLCRVLHDWSDEKSTQILTNVARSMSPTTRLVVIDAVVPQEEIPHPSKIMDIFMLALHEGRERTETQFAELFAAAGLRHIATHPTESSVGLVLAERSA